MDRRATTAEQVADLHRNWAGPRCPHGVPAGAPGPDVICGRCEAEAADFVLALELAEEMDARLAAGEPMYEFPAGPDRNLEDSRVRMGLVADRAPAPDTDLPF